MPDYGHDLRFGAFLTPDAGNLQDHPYQARHLDMWTLLAASPGSRTPR